MSKNVEVATKNAEESQVKLFKSQCKSYNPSDLQKFIKKNFKHNGVYVVYWKGKDCYVTDESIDFVKDDFKAYAHKHYEECNEDSISYARLYNYDEKNNSVRQIGRARTMLSDFVSKNGTENVSVEIGKLKFYELPQSRFRYYPLLKGKENLKIDVYIQSVILHSNTLHNFKKDLKFLVKNDTSLSVSARKELFIKEIEKQISFVSIPKNCNVESCKSYYDEIGGSIKKLNLIENGYSAFSSLKKDMNDVRSKRRKVTQEVFTPPCVTDMILANVSQETFTDFSKKVLDPSCGNGNILVAMLAKRLEHCSAKYDAINAMITIFGVDFMADNVEECRTRLYNKVIEKFPDIACGVENCLLRNVIKNNIRWGDALNFDYDQFEQNVDFKEQALEGYDYPMFKKIETEQAYIKQK